MKVWDKSGMNSCWQLHEDVQGFGSETIELWEEGFSNPKKSRLLRENEPRLERNIPIFQKKSMEPWSIMKPRGGRVISQLPPQKKSVWQVQRALSAKTT